MLKQIIPFLLLATGLMGFAQHNPSVTVGRTTTQNKVEVTVTADSAGTIILSSPDHSIYLNRRFAKSVDKNLGSIITGMRELETKDIEIVDYQMICKLNPDGSNESSKDGIIFRFEFNKTKNDKILLSMQSTTEKEDLFFTLAGVIQLQELVGKAMKSVSSISAQYENIQSAVDRINSMSLD